jgi:hypothetical protein
VILNNELEGIMEEVAMAYFKMLYKKLPRGTETKHDSISQNM